MFIVSISTNNEIYLMTNSKGEVTAFDTLYDAKEYFEGSYRRKHGSSYESSMSACVHFIMFQPAIHEIEKPEDLIEGGIVEIPFSICNLSSIAGRMSGIRCKGIHAGEWHKKGVTPSLIGA